MRGRLVILSGPSGVGKDTLLEEWTKLNPRVQRVVAYTTREPRPGEAPDVDYHFVDEGEFMRKAECGEFLEYKSVFGNFYATPLHDTEAMLQEGKIAVLKIDVQGALSVMDLRPDALTIFILSPSEEELKRRIVGRGTDDASVIERRLAKARDEIALAGHYQHRIVNDCVDTAVKQLEALVADA